MKKLIIAALMLSLAVPAFAAAPPAAPAKAATVSGTATSAAAKVDAKADAKPAKDNQAAVKSDASAGGKLINKGGNKKP